MHNAAFRTLGLDCVYVAFTVTLRALPGAVAAIRALGLRGVNVTMPLKTEIALHLERLEPAARFLQTVNTVVNCEGVLIGYSTDGPGALRALGEAGVRVDDVKVAVLGAGGAARAIAYQLVHSCSELAILNRKMENAVALAQLLRPCDGAKVSPRPLTEAALAEELVDSVLVVNATPLGMRPLEGETPVPSRLLRSDLAVFDLVYDPENTRLLTEAREVGAKTIDGISMLVHQGAESFRVWTGRNPPTSVMMQAVRGALRVRAPGLEGRAH